MEWPQARVCFLIREFKRRPALWDVNCLDYRNKNIRYNSLMEICRIMNTSMKEIEKKIHSLKVQFSREYCLVKRKKAESPDDTNYIPKWYGYKLLLFLRNSRNSTFKTRLYQNERFGNNGKILFTRNMGRIEKPKIILPPLKQDQQIDRNENIDKNDENNDSKIDEESKSLPNEDNNFEKSDQNTFRNEKNIEIRNQQTTNIPNNDEFTLFGQYIASKLRNLNDIYLQALTKHSINQVIFDTEMRQCQQALINRPPPPVIENCYSRNSPPSEEGPLENDIGEDEPDINLPISDMKPEGSIHISDSDD